MGGTAKFRPKHEHGGDTDGAGEIAEPPCEPYLRQAGDIGQPTQVKGYHSYRGADRRGTEKADAGKSDNSGGCIESVNSVGKTLHQECADERLQRIAAGD